MFQFNDFRAYLCVVHYHQRQMRRFGTWLDVFDRELHGITLQTVCPSQTRLNSSHSIRERVPRAGSRMTTLPALSTPSTTTIWLMGIPNAYNVVAKGPWAMRAVKVWRGCVKTSIKAPNHPWAPASLFMASARRVASCVNTEPCARAIALCVTATPWLLSNIAPHAGPQET